MGRWVVFVAIIFLTIYSPLELSRVILATGEKTPELSFELSFIWFSYLVAMITLAIIFSRSHFKGGDG